jgi:hypothetical protein
MCKYGRRAPHRKKAAFITSQLKAGFPSWCRVDGRRRREADIDGQQPSVPRERWVKSRTEKENEDGATPRSGTDFTNFVEATLAKRGVSRTGFRAHSFSS